MRMIFTARWKSKKAGNNKTDAKAAAQYYRNTASYSWDIISLFTPCDPFSFNITGGQHFPGQCRGTCDTEYGSVSSLRCLGHPNDMNQHRSSPKNRARLRRVRHPQLQASHPRRALGEVLA